MLLHKIEIHGTTGDDRPSGALRVGITSSSSFNNSNILKVFHVFNVKKLKHFSKKEKYFQKLLLKVFLQIFLKDQKYLKNIQK